MNKNKNREIPIFFTMDNGFAPVLGPAIQSLVTNADPTRQYRIIVITEDLSEENKEILRQMVTDAFTIDFIPLEKTLEKIPDIKENHLRCDFFSITIFYRLFLAEMFPQYDKAVYLDSDVIVPGDISKFYDHEIGETFFGAIPDLAVAAIPEFSYYVQAALNIPNTSYVNSGVLLMNLKVLRDTHFSEHFLDLMEKYHFDTVAPDQDYLNAICAGKLTFLEHAWDVMPAHDQPEMPTPEIIHYNLFDKPWHYAGTQYEEYFWQYAKETPYYDELMQMRDAYSDEEKKSDEQALGTMLQKASTIPDNEITFRKLEEKGVAIRL